MDTCLFRPVPRRAPGAFTRRRLSVAGTEREVVPEHRALTLKLAPDAEHFSGQAVLTMRVRFPLAKTSYSWLRSDRLPYPSHARQAFMTHSAPEPLPVVPRPSISFPMASEDLAHRIEVRRQPS